MLSGILGGLGLFLVGMIMLTDGLKRAAGAALERWLARLTGGPISGALTGATVTAIVQSSSATTLATIGFVSAGLLSFPQAIALVIGANVGTTSTSWLVALVGVKVDPSALAYPAVGLGALLRLGARGRAREVGLVCAGFGIVFVGLATLQQSMATLAEAFTIPTALGSGLGGRLLLAAIGAVMTVVMQSSSAAAAATLTALAAGTLDLPQAAALVVGQNVGTTVTAAIAAVGGSLAARRTAAAHIGFNVVTGALALAILPLFVAGVRAAAGQLAADDPALLLASFHTAFNLLGLALFLPFVRRFARAIERWLPETGPGLTRALDSTVLEVPAVASEAARRTARRILDAALAEGLRRLAPEAQAPAEPADATARALERLREFVARISSDPGPSPSAREDLRVLKAIDHLDALLRLISGWSGPASDVELVAAAQAELSRRWARARAALAADPEGEGTAAAPTAGSDARWDAQLRAARRELIARSARGELAPDDSLRALAWLRELGRAAFHAERAAAHCGPQAGAAALEPADPGIEPDVAERPDPARPGGAAASTGPDHPPPRS